MLDVKTLPGFADVDARLPIDGDTRIAVQLLVMQAYAAGMEAGSARAREIVTEEIVDARQAELRQ